MQSVQVFEQTLLPTLTSLFQSIIHVCFDNQCAAQASTGRPANDSNERYCYIFEDTLGTANERTVTSY
jgi:hypothetical protein